MHDEPEGLECRPELLLEAFKLVGGYETGKSNIAKLEHRKELALSLVDWLLMESDRGIPMLELRAQMAITPRPDDKPFFNIGFP